MAAAAHDLTDSEVLRIQSLPLWHAYSSVQTHSNVQGSTLNIALVTYVCMCVCAHAYVCTHMRVCACMRTCGCTHHSWKTLRKKMPNPIMLQHTSIIEPGYPIKVVFDSRKKMFVPTSAVGCSYTCCCYQVISYCLWSDAFFSPLF